MTTSDFTAPRTDRAPLPAQQGLLGLFAVTKVLHPLLPHPKLWPSWATIYPITGSAPLSALERPPPPLASPSKKVQTTKILKTSDSITTNLNIASRPNPLPPSTRAFVGHPTACLGPHHDCHGRCLSTELCQDRAKRRRKPDKQSTMNPHQKNKVDVKVCISSQLYLV